MKLTARMIQDELHALATPAKAASSAWFFKTGVGGYSAGDKFIGITVPEQRRVAKGYRGIVRSELAKLLMTDVHEYRLTALIILVDEYERGDVTIQKSVFEFFTAHTKWINNWDLVDATAPYIVGHYLVHHMTKTAQKEFLGAYIKSHNMWENRIAVVATMYQIKSGDSSLALSVIPQLLAHPHDLIHKAMGWMLREVGKNCGEVVLLAFLQKYYHKLPRTTLRYAIERFPEAKRKELLKGEFGTDSKMKR